MVNSQNQLPDILQLVLQFPNTTALWVMEPTIPAVQNEFQVVLNLEQASSVESNIHEFISMERFACKCGMEAAAQGAEVLHVDQIMGEVDIAWPTAFNALY